MVAARTQMQTFAVNTRALCRRPLRTPFPAHPSLALNTRTYWQRLACGVSLVVFLLLLVVTLSATFRLLTLRRNLISQVLSQEYGAALPLPALCKLSATFVRSPLLNKASST
jgi:hypothetical protein